MELCNVNEMNELSVKLVTSPHEIAIQILPQKTRCEKDVRKLARFIKNDQIFNTDRSVT